MFSPLPPTYAQCSLRRAKEFVCIIHFGLCPFRPVSQSNSLFVEEITKKSCAATLCQKESMLHFARSVSSSLIFMNVGLWTGGILVFHLVLLGVPVALFARFRTPGTPAVMIVSPFMINSAIVLWTLRHIWISMYFILNLQDVLYIQSQCFKSKWYGKVDWPIRSRSWVRRGVDGSGSFSKNEAQHRMFHQFWALKSLSTKCHFLVLLSARNMSWLLIRCMFQNEGPYQIGKWWIFRGPDVKTHPGPCRIRMS